MRKKERESSERRGGASVLLPSRRSALSRLLTLSSPIFSPHARQGATRVLSLNRALTSVGSVVAAAAAGNNNTTTTAAAATAVPAARPAGAGTPPAFTKRETIKDIQVRGEREAQGVL